MGVEAWTEVRLKTIPSDPLGLLGGLEKNGWNFHGAGEIFYTDLGDVGRFEYKDAPIGDLPRVKGVLQQKVASKEQPLAISVTWKSTEIGGELLFYYLDRRILFSWTCNRKRRSDSDRYTDLPWYDKIVSESFAEAGIPVESISSGESD